MLKGRYNRDIRNQRIHVSMKKWLKTLGTFLILSCILNKIYFSKKVYSGNCRKIFIPVHIPKLIKYSKVEEHIREIIQRKRASLPVS
jgi:hypothetical protein